MLSERVGLTNKTAVNPLLGQCESVGKMLRALIRSLQAKR